MDALLIDSLSVYMPHLNKMQSNSDLSVRNDAERVNEALLVGVALFR